MVASLLHILIVDDSPEDCYTVRRLLRADPRIATITEADRGDLTITAEPGEGTNVLVFLPIGCPNAVPEDLP